MVSSPPPQQQPFNSFVENQVQFAPNAVVAIVQKLPKTTTFLRTRLDTGDGFEAGIANWQAPLQAWSCLNLYNKSCARFIGNSHI